jgi:hypothetical protein
MSTQGLVVASSGVLLLPVAGTARTAISGSIAGVVRDTSGADRPGRLTPNLYSTRADTNGDVWSGGIDNATDPPTVRHGD